MRILCFLFYLLSFFCLGCNKKEVIAPNKDQNLKICLSSDVRSLDPRSSNEHPSGHVVKMLFEGLFRIDLDGKIKPAAVDTYEVSSDKKRYTFHLKSTKWSNGKEVTADDFVYAWKQVIDPKLSNNGVHSFYPIKNVQAVILGQAHIDEVGIKAVDEKTLVVDLEHPAPYFLEALTLSSFCPISQEQDILYPNWSEKEAGDFICNGPFILKEWKKGYELVLEKNPLFWDAKSVCLTQIQIAIMTDVSTQLSMFEKEEIDWLGKPLGKLPLDAIPSLKAAGKINHSSSLGIYWYFINTTSFPFNNVKIRKAFSYAINRKEITDYLLQENERVATSILPFLLSNKKQHFEDGNITIALKLFEQGMQELDTTLDQISPITLSYASSEINDKVAQSVQQQWQNVFGVKVILQHQDWASYYDKLVKGNYQIGGMSWYSLLHDPSYTLEIFKHTSDGINMSRWQNSEYQSYLDAANEEIDEEKRLLLFQKAEELLLEEMPVIPLYFINTTFAKKDNLTNFYISELNEVDFTWAYFK